MKNKFTLLLLSLVSSLSSVAQDWSDMAKVVATDRVTVDYFGNTVSIDGDYAIVGSPFSDGDENGENEIPDAGAAYIYKREANAWVQQQKLVASDRAESDQFGYTVAINGDYAVIAAAGGGSNNGGSAYIFKKEGELWEEQQTITGSDTANGNVFGANVDIDGNYIIVGAHFNNSDGNNENPISNSGAAYIFVRDGETWLQQQKLVASDREEDDRYGISVAIDGDYAVVGSYYENEDANGENTLADSGSAYIYKRDGATWSQQKKIVNADRESGDNFGISVDISGNYLVVGAAWEDDDVNDQNSVSYSGSAYVFNRSGETWTQQQKIISSDRTFFGQFGGDVAIDMDRIIVGANSAIGKDGVANSGSAYVYKRTDDVWGAEEKIVAIDASAAGDYFGNSVAITNGYAIVGAFNETDDANGENPIALAGSSYIYKNCAFDTSVTASDTDLSANFTEGGIGYQWLDCNNENSPIEGATAQIYVPSANGTYSVQLTRTNGCVEVSGCVEFESLTAGEHILPQFSVYPNPASQNLNIALGNGVQLPTAYAISNSLGQLVDQRIISNEAALVVPVAAYESGVYFIKIIFHGGAEVFKFIVK